MEKVFPRALRKTIRSLSKLPGLGEKSATRLALFLLRYPELVEELMGALSGLKEVRLCRECGNFCEEDLCSICSDESRNRGIICVVEDPSSLYAVESSGAFEGVYHVLHGVLSPRDGIGPEELRIPELLQRIRRNGTKEVVLGLSPTVAGEATASYLLETLKDLPVRISRLACGLALGMEVKYADYMTLRKAIKLRELLKD